MRKIVLCADDYGMSAGVSRAIRELAEAGRISATAAMTASPAWPAEAAALRPLAGRVGIGLHLTLTFGAPLGPMPRFAPGGAFPTLRSVAVRSLAGRLPAAEITAEIGRQLEAFRAGMDAPPDFVDGHQHVHALPGIRTALLAVLAERGLAGRAWLRDPFDRPGAIVVRGVAAGKALVVAGLSLGFGSRARRAGFDTNRGFSGFSPFDPGRDALADLDRCLAAPGPAHLVMCHPGHLDPGDVLDGVLEPRARELDALRSDGFAYLLSERGITLTSRPAHEAASLRGGAADEAT